MKNAQSGPGGKGKKYKVWFRQDKFVLQKQKRVKNSISIEM